MGDVASKASKIASVTGRADIEFLSLFVLDVREAENKVVSLSSSISSLIGFATSKDNIPSLGFPMGEIWDSIKRVDFQYYEVNATPLSLSSSHTVTLYYDAETQKILRQRTRKGVTHETVQEKIRCGIKFPISGMVANRISQQNRICLCAFDVRHTLIEDSEIFVPNVLSL